MQIVFVGAGGIGGYFGGRLAAAGAQVAFLARGRHAQALREQGLRITSPLGHLHLPVTVAEDPAALPAADLVVFAVKLPDAQAAAAQLPAWVRPGAVVLPLQNGVDAAELLARHVGAPAVAQGLAYIATRIAAPGCIEHGGDFARLRFGALQPAQAPLLQRFLETCRAAGIDAEMPADIRRAVWEKFVFLVGLSGLTALTRQSVGVVRADRELRGMLQAVMAEATALGRAEGVDLPADYAEQRMAFVDTLPHGMKASMLHDLEAGRPLELPWLAAAVVRRSARCGLQAPVNRFIAASLGPLAGGVPSQGVPPAMPSTPTP
jgi:2-dehydropantoate 2-reductase